MASKVVSGPRLFDPFDRLTTDRTFMAVQDAQSAAKLHDETLSELGLTEQPFLEDKKRQHTADATTQKTRAALEQHVRFGDSLHLLIGEEGAGKTVLLQQLLKHCKNNLKPFVVKGSESFRADAFLYAVLNNLNPQDSQSDDSEESMKSIDELIDTLGPIFEQISADQLSALLIIDDAHLAPIEEIAELVDVLQQFENEDGKTARLLLTGTPALKQSIAGYEAQFEGLNLNYSTTQMQPLDEARTREYLSARLHQAGFADTFPFTDKAISKIHRDSDGLPGRINDTATHYLNGVYRSTGTATTKAGWLSSIEWPVLAIGAAALAAIGLGLSMFFGNEPETEVIPVAVTESATQLEQPVVETTSVPTTDTDTSQDLYVQPSDPVVENTEVANAETAVVSPEATTILQETNPIGTTEETDIAASQPSTDSQLALPQTNPQENIPAQNVAEAENPVNVALPLDNDVVAGVSDVNDNDVTLQAPRDTSIVVPDNKLLSENASIAGSTTIIDATAAADTTSGQQDILVEDDTDASAQAPEDNTIGTTSPADTGVVVDQNRAIENERWVLYQSPLKFTVQLATSRERSYIIELAQTMELQDPIAIYPFLTTNSNNPVFGLLSGLYDTRAEAIAAVEVMGEKAKQFGVWIRPVSDLQADIKRRN